MSPPRGTAPGSRRNRLSPACPARSAQIPAGTPAQRSHSEAPRPAVRGRHARRADPPAAPPADPAASCGRGGREHLDRGPNRDGRRRGQHLPADRLPARCLACDRRAPQACGQTNQELRASECTEAPRYGRLTFNVWWRRHKVLKSGTARSNPTSRKRLSASPVACLRDTPKRTFIVRQAGTASSLKDCCRWHLQVGRSVLTILGSNQPLTHEDMCCRSAIRAASMRHCKPASSWSCTSKGSNCS